MNKETIEIERDINHIHSYMKRSYLDENSEIILNKLIEWSKGNSYHIYRHRVKYVEENIGQNGKTYTPDCDKSLKILYCDLVCYLDIYYQ